MLPLIAGAAIIGAKMFGDYMGNKKKGYDAARKELRRYWEEAKGYEKPFMQNGLDQYGRLNDAENKLLNPYDLENQWAGGYEESPYAKYLQEENMGQGLDAASSMGLMGSSGALSNIQQGAGRITSEDRKQFMQDLMQKYLAGIGLGKSFYDTGANAANALTQDAMQMGGNQAGLKYGSANANGEMWNKMMGTLSGGIANMYMPGSGQMMNSGNAYNS
jgi:hypothetical protein